MKLFKRLSIQGKLILLLLAIGIVAVASVGYVAYSTGREALRNSVFNELTTVRASKKHQIEGKFARFGNQAITLSSDPMIVECMRAFRPAFSEMRHAKVEFGWDAKISAFYEKDFLPQLAKNVEGKPEPQAYLPKTIEGRYLQYLYIAANANPMGKKYLLRGWDDGSRYSALHEIYHPFLVKYVLDFGYGDLYLIDSDTGDVIYTFAKSPIFATNVKNGPYSDTNIRVLYNALAKSADKHAVQLADFAPYPPEFGRPVALIGSPIYDGDKKIGILAMQIPVKEINDVMTGGRAWSLEGLGKSGESYLVGSDGFMRSDARMLIENKQQYIKDLAAAGVSVEDRARIQRENSTILAMPVRTKAVQYASAGEEGISVMPNSRGIPALMSYAPVKVPGVQWMIVAEKEEDEAFAPLNSLSRQVLFFAVAIILLITAVAVALAGRFVRPIHQLVTDVEKLEAGKPVSPPQEQSQDEFSELAAAFLGIAKQIKSNRELVKHKGTENEQLLLNIMPASIAARFRNGETNVIEEYADSSVLSAYVEGWTELAQQRPPDEAVLLIHDLVEALDEATDRFGVEKVSLEGSEYLAACGMSLKRLDHGIRLVDFGQDILRIVGRFNSERGTRLNVQIGIASGSVFGALVGGSKLRFELIGQSVRAARWLARECPPNSILTTGSIREATADLVAFESPISIAIPGQAAEQVWPVRSAAAVAAGKVDSNYV